MLRKWPRVEDLAFKGKGVGSYRPAPTGVGVGPSPPGNRRARQGRSQLSERL